MFPPLNIHIFHFPLSWKTPDKVKCFRWLKVIAEQCLLCHFNISFELKHLHWPKMFSLHYKEQNIATVIFVDFVPNRSKTNTEEIKKFKKNLCLL